jgi:hypothetical protein
MISRVHRTLVAGALAAAVALSACSNETSPEPQEAPETTVASSGTLPTEPDPTIEDPGTPKDPDGATDAGADDGAAPTTSGSSMPAGFPDSVPLPAGGSLVAAQELSDDGRAWIAAWGLVDTSEQACEEYFSAYTSSGWEETLRSATSVVTTVLFEDEGWTAQVTCGPGVEGVSVSIDGTQA